MKEKLQVAPGGVVTANGTLRVPAVSSTYLGSIVETAIALGGDGEVLHGLVPGGAEALADPDQRFDGLLAARILDVAAEQTGLDSIGLRVGMQFRPATFVDVGYALSAASTIRQALEINIRYQVLTQDVARMRLDFCGNELRIALEAATEDAEVMRRVTEAFLAGYASIGRWLLWDQQKPLAGAAFRHKAPGKEARDFYDVVFGGNVAFEAPEDALVIDAALAARPLPNANPALVQLLTGRLNARLAAFRAGSSLRMLVMSGLHKQIRKGKPSLDGTAKLIGMSGRTLRRRLLGEGLSYSELLAATRKEAAEVYLHEEKLTLAEIAGLVGYSDQTAFMRAFRGWFGESPGAYRERLRERGE